MEKNFVTIGLSWDSRRVCAVLCCVLVLFAAGMQVQRVSALFAPRLLIDPVFTKLNEGQSFTVTVNLTDDSDLFLWQVVIEWDGTVLNLTDVFIPDNSVFAGHIYQQGVPPKDQEASGDLANGLNWTMVGASLLGADTVSVSNGILFSANFTALSAGSTTVTLKTIAEKIDAAWYTYVIDSNFDEYNAFQTVGATMAIGNADVKPIALFTVAPQDVENTTNLLLNAPPQVPYYAVTYANYATFFNATASYAPVGNITEYVWDFSDGNVTTVDATPPGSAYITHVFTLTGNYSVVLTVVGSGNPPLNGTYTIVVYVGLVLPLYNWSPFIYAVSGIMAAIIVLYAAISVVRRARRRKELKRQKMLTAEPTGRPPTGAQAT